MIGSAATAKTRGGNVLYFWEGFVCMFFSEFIALYMEKGRIYNINRANFGILHWKFTQFANKTTLNKWIL